MSQEYVQRKEGQLMRHYLAQVSDNFVYRTILSVLCAIVTSIGHFYSDLVWWFFAMFAIDFATGVFKSMKNGVRLTSKRYRDSVYKLGGYMFLISALIVASKFQEDFVVFVTLAYYYFMLVELKSIFENVQEMGVKVPSFLMLLVNLKLKNVVSAASKLLSKYKEEDKDGDDSKPS